MLQFDDTEWRFETPGEIAPGVLEAFLELINAIASQTQSRFDILDHFSKHFARAADATYYRSSSLHFAEGDLRKRYMEIAALHAPRFIEAFFDGCQSLLQKYPDITIPDASRINRTLLTNEAGYEIETASEIDPPRLRCCNPQPPVPVPLPPTSMRQQVQAAFQQALAASENALVEGNPRQAVTELLWLMESFSTAFTGIEVGERTVKGKYFNPIIRDLIVI